MSTEGFFEESREQSVVKAAIVAKYFWAWAKVIIPTAKTHEGKIAYIDLFAGPGRYKDGTKSTPLLILETAIQDKDMRDMLVTIFNDKDPTNTQSLQTAINAMPGIEGMKFHPRILTEEVGEEMVCKLEQWKLVPTLFFVDPWGYKGLSLRLINSVLKNWGCDCIFFFNYNRINMGLGNDYVKAHMDALFGEERAARLRERLESLPPEQRELTIVEEIAEALQKMGGKFVLPFCFRNEAGTRTSHHLIFVSKHYRGYEIMKEIMAKESSTIEQGVPSFMYCAADIRQPILFGLSRPLDDLAEMLLTDMAGRRLTMKQVFESHNIGKPYISRNYKDALRQLEAEEKISVTPPADRRRKVKGEVTFADDTQVQFQKR